MPNKPDARGHTQVNNGKIDRQRFKTSFLPNKAVFD